MSDSFETPWAVAHQASLSLGFRRQEYCSGLPFPSPGNLPDAGIEPVSCIAGGFFTTELQGVNIWTYLLTLNTGSFNIWPQGVCGLSIQPPRHVFCRIQKQRLEE